MSDIVRNQRLDRIGSNLGAGFGWPSVCRFQTGRILRQLQHTTQIADRRTDPADPIRARITDPIPTAVQPIRIQLDVPEAFRAKAMYGLRMLLLPFRVAVSWVDDPGSPVDIYYGTQAAAGHRAAIAVVLKPETIAWFVERRAGFPPFRRVGIGDQAVPVCFDAGGHWDHDPVATVLYLLSGWQEVVEKTRDEHGRFPFAASFQAHADVARIPVVDWVRSMFRDRLREAGIPLERRTFGDKSWAFCATHDVDYVRKWRPGIWKREMLDRALLNRDREPRGVRLARARRAIRSLFESGDPFRSALTRISAELEARRARGTFFYKAAAHGFRDVDYALEDAFVQSTLFRQLQAGHEVGLHPSYHSYAHPARLTQEKQRLEAAAGRGVHTHRAHYLRFDHPRSVRHLGAAGFTVDSTLGWATESGFRYGTCLPFPLFDPVLDEESTVWEIPLLSMESALFNRQHLSTSDAIADTKGLMDTCQAFGGIFTGLWHTTLWDEADYPGWGAHFEASLAHAEAKGARMDTLSGTLDSWS